jgi:transposase
MAFPILGARLQGTPTGTLKNAATKIEEHHRLKYACRGCEQHGTRNPIKQAPPVASILPKSYATPSLIAQLITAKYQHGLPLYRQEVIFNQLGIRLCRQTMSDWLIKIANVLYPVLYEYWHKILLQQDVIKADETTLQVINEDNIKSYMWVYSSGADSPAGNLQGDSAPNIVLYDYQPSRAGKCAVDFYKTTISSTTQAIYRWTAILVIANCTPP